MIQSKQASRSLILFSRAKHIMTRKLSMSSSARVLRVHIPFFSIELNGWSFALRDQIFFNQIVVEKGLD
jgi:hypothetical protein